MNATTRARLIVTVAVIALMALVLSTLRYRWRWDVALTWLPALGRALWTTLWISVLSLIIGTVMGFVAALGRLSPRVVPNQLAVLYIESIRSTPLLVQLILLYYAIAPQVGINNPFVIAVAGLAIFAGAYIAEIFRAGIVSIERGQTEAARSLGMSSWQALVHVVLPQMTPRVLPPLTGLFISNIKDSSLLSVISVSELTKVTRDAASTHALAFELYLMLAVGYVVITLPLAIVNRRLEERLRAGR